MKTSSAKYGLYVKQKAEIKKETSGKKKLFAKFESRISESEHPFKSIYEDKVKGF